MVSNKHLSFLCGKDVQVEEHFSDEWLKDDWNLVLFLIPNGITPFLPLFWSPSG